MSFEKEERMRSIAEDLKIKNVAFCDKRIIVLGDVHGCYDEMDRLLDMVDYSPRDVLISVGDLIMKGPDSGKVLDFFLADPARLAVKGNHEYAVQRWYEYIHFARDGEPIPFGLKEGSEHHRFAETMSEEDYEYIRNMPHILQMGGGQQLVVVHAGINPRVHLDSQNSFDVMHVRNIDQDKCTEKISVGDPWTRLLVGSNDPIYVFGHDATRGLQEGTNYCGLDSACVYGKKLSAAVFHRGTREIFSVDARKAYCECNPGAIL